MSGTVYQQSETTLGQGQWLKLVRADFVDKHGKQRSWECFRRLKTSTTVQCVDLFTVLLSDHSGPQLILVKQYRAPSFSPSLYLSHALLSPPSCKVNAYTYEFPAGLIGPGEDPYEASIRELYVFFLLVYSLNLNLFSFRKKLDILHPSPNRLLLPPHHLPHLNLQTPASQSLHSRTPIPSLVLSLVTLRLLTHVFTL